MVATGPKVTTGHILVKTHHILIKREDYISLVKIFEPVKNRLICIIVAMATAIRVPMDVCPLREKLFRVSDSKYHHAVVTLRNNVVLGSDFKCFMTIVSCSIQVKI